MMKRHGRQVCRWHSHSFTIRSVFLETDLLAGRVVLRTFSAGLIMPIIRQGRPVLLLLAIIGCRPAPRAPENSGPASNADTTTPTAGTPDPAGRPSDGTLAEFHTEVMRLVGDATCSDVSQCRTIAFGAKPCGGPWQYLVYSSAITDSAALTAAVARYNAKESELNKSEGRVSDCALVAPPRLARVNGRCVAAP
jgi:hypothetical protein